MYVKYYKTKITISLVKTFVLVLNKNKTDIDFRLIYPH